MNSRESLLQASGPVAQFRAAAKVCLRLLKHGRPLLLAGLSVALLGLLGSTTASAADPPLAGTWLVEVSFNGATCSPGETILFTCSFGFITFNSDGTMAEVDTFASGGKQSWAAGIWKEQGTTNVFDTTFEQLQFNGTYSPSHYDTVWGPITYHPVNGSTPEYISGTGKFVSYYFDGTIINIPGFSGTFTSKGYRMVMCTDTSSNAQCKEQPPTNF
jgi:hypothetical protein